MKFCWTVLFAASLAAAGAFAQAPAFEVATVKPAPPPERPTMGRSTAVMKIDDARVSISNATVAELIAIAFRVRPYQVSGPAWLKNTGASAPRFVVQAKIPDGASKEQAPEMLQALLAERFQLTFHREDRDQPVYALIIGKNGSKLHEVEAAPAPDAPPAPSKVTPVTGGNTIHMEQDLTITGLCDLAMRFLDRPVIDQTNLKGKYHMLVELSIDDMRTIASRNGSMGADAKPMETAADPTGGSIFSSVQDMGLKLDPRRMTVPMLIIDRLKESPVEN
jgi:uncharacterized protein (TIGR03435 family)